MLNEKMSKVANSIGGVIWATYPEDYLSSVFVNKVSDYEVVLQILFECCKYAFDHYSGPATDILGKHSLRYYLPKIDGVVIDGTENSERLVAQYTLDQINRWKEDLYDFYLDQGVVLPEEFLPPNMSDHKSRFTGYELTPFQFWEIMDYHDTRLEKAIVKQYISNKNFTYDSFEEYLKEYDCRLRSYRDQANNNDEDMVFNTLKAFVLEWKYKVSFLYQIAKEMGMKNMTCLSEAEAKIALFSGIIRIQSELAKYFFPYSNCRIITESRMLRLRTEYIHEIVVEKECVDNNEEFRSFYEALFLVADSLRGTTYQGLSLREWFCQKTDISDWASVFREYDIFRYMTLEKELNKKTMRNMRYLLSAGVVKL